MLSPPSSSRADHLSVSSHADSFDSRFTVATDHSGIRYEVHDFQTPMTDVRTLYGMMYYNLYAESQNTGRQQAFDTLAAVAIAGRNRAIPNFRGRQYSNAPPDPLRRRSLTAPPQVRDEKSPAPEKQTAIARLKDRGRKAVRMFANLLRGKDIQPETALPPDARAHNVDSRRL
jgi:hypothetical protein